MNRLRHVPLLVLLLLLPAGLRAQVTDERLRAASDLVDAMDMETHMRRAMELTMAHQIEVNPELEPVRGIMMSYIGRALEFEEFRGEVVNLYAELFTADDMRVLAEFYQSPVGQRLLALTPELTVGIQIIAEERLAPLLPEMQAEMMRKLMGQE